MQQTQQMGRALRVMENQLEIIPLTKAIYERLKKKHEDKNVATDVYGNVVHNYTLN
jgi:hypothetical protein